MERFGALDRAVELLESVVAGFDADLVDGHCAARLVEQFARVETLGAAGKALAARRAAEAHFWKHEGHATAAHWLARATGTTVGAAHEVLQTAKALAHLPATQAAFRAGELSATQAREIASAASADPTAEEGLLAVAARASVKDLRDRCRRVHAAAAADDAARARRQHERRRVHLWQEADGTGRVDAYLAADTWGRLQRALETEASRLERGARTAGLGEPHAAYLADALVSLITGGGDRPPVQASLVVHHDAIRRGHVLPGERCELDGAPIPVTAARTLLGDAVISVLAGDGTDLHTVGEPTRTIPARLRRWLESAYPTCGVPGCGNERCLQIDHVVPLHEGGLSSRDNTWRICAHHHALKTHHGWRVTGAPGRWDLVPPEARAGPDAPDPPP